MSCGRRPMRRRSGSTPRTRLSAIGSPARSTTCSARAPDRGASDRAPNHRRGKAGARPSVASSCEDASSPTGEIMSPKNRAPRFSRLRGILAVVVVILLMGWFATENREALTKVYSTITEALPTSSQAQPVPDGAWLELGPTSIDPQQLASLDVAEQDRSEDDYERDEFGDGWASVGDGCDTRDQILNRDLVEITYEDGSDCEATDGTLHDPYTGITIDGNLSEDVQA